MAKNNNLPCGVNAELCPKEEINREMLKVSKMLLEWTEIPAGERSKKHNDQTDFEFLANEIIPLADNVIREIEKATGKKIEDVLKQ